MPGWGGSNTACENTQQWGPVFELLGSVWYAQTVLFSHLYIKPIVLPRQARDKHRENSKNRPPFLSQGGAGAALRRHIAVQRLR